MKKFNYFILSTFCILINFSCTTDKEKKLSDIEKMKLKGNIKSIKSVEYDAKEKFGKIVKEKITYDKYPNYEIAFNKSGNQIEFSSYPYGKLKSKRTYKYDEKGNITELNEYSSNGNLLKKSIYNYDNESNLSNCNIYKSDGSLENKIVWSYINNKLKEYTKLDSDKKTILKYVYKYENDDLTEAKQYGLKGNLDNFKYDSNSNLIKQEELNSNENLIKLETSVFDSENNIIEKNIYDSDNVLENKHTYRYNKNNNLIEHTNDDIGWGTFTYRYNENGELYEQVNFNLKKENTYNLKKIYIYDDNGNWIKLTEFKGVLPNTINEREIIYY